jgi:LysM repeat protein
MHSGITYYSTFAKIFSALLMLSVMSLSTGIVEAQSARDQLKQIRSEIVDTIDGKPYYIHKIKRGQTLYMISKAYGVEVNDLIRENPGVKEGIKADETLKVPIKYMEKPADKKNLPVLSADTLRIADSAKNRKPSEFTNVQVPCVFDTMTRKEIYRIALMLPLFLADAQKLPTDNPVRSEVEEARSLQFLPFYEGFRMAVDSMAMKGMKVKLYVYDVDKDTLKTRQLLKKSELTDMDLIVGLLYHRNFQIVAEYAENHHIPIVNPISERSDIVKKNSYIIKLQPEKASIAQALAQYLSGTTADAQIFILHNGQYPVKQFPEEFVGLCKQKSLSVKLVEGQQSLYGQLSKERENYIVAASSSTEYIADFTRRLFELRNDYRINVIGLSDWHLINGVELEYLDALKTHSVVSGFINYEDPAVTRFVSVFQQTYKLDPPMLAFQGYDAGWFFLNALERHGSGFLRCLSELEVKSMLTRFVFQRKSSADGFENRQWIVTHFQNYKLIPEPVF